MSLSYKGRWSLFQFGVESDRRHKYSVLKLVNGKLERIKRGYLKQRYHVFDEKLSFGKEIWSYCEGHHNSHLRHLTHNKVRGKSDSKTIQVPVFRLEQDHWPSIHYLSIGCYFSSFIDIAVKS